MNNLVCNAGSTSLKYQLIAIEGETFLAKDITGVQELSGDVLAAMDGAAWPRRTILHTALPGPPVATRRSPPPRPGSGSSSSLRTRRSW